jgi:hypothetical protein
VSTLRENLEALRARLELVAVFYDEDRPGQSISVKKDQSPLLDARRIITCPGTAALGIPLFCGCSSPSLAE